MLTTYTDLHNSMADTSHHPHHNLPTMADTASPLPHHSSTADTSRCVAMFGLRMPLNEPDADAPSRVHHHSSMDTRLPIRHRHLRTTSSSDQVRQRIGHIEWAGTDSSSSNGQSICTRQPRSTTASAYAGPKFRSRSTKRLLVPVLCVHWTEKSTAHWYQLFQPARTA